MTVTAQKKRLKQKPVSFQKHYNEILPAKPQFKPSGWLFGPGVSYMATTFVPVNKVYQKTETSQFNARLSALGRPGLYAEVGRYRMFQYSKLIKYMDYGISYKSLRGRENAEGQYVSLPGEVVSSPMEETSGLFGYHYAEAFLNLNHVWRIGKYNFIQNSIGANAGYAFLANQSGTTVSAAANANPGQFITQLHYKLGYGIKMRGNWLMIPALETPILNVLPFEPPRSSLGFFASRYRPVILSVRFFFMRPANTLDCTPVRTREGLKMPTDMDKQKQMDQTK
ncbi:MAG: hypothetical protein Salg2KO_16520 [Salibacteraceae bacterium]